MKLVNLLCICHILLTSTAESFFGQVYGNTKNVGHKIAIIARNFSMNSIRLLNTPIKYAVTDHNFRKQFARSKLARGSAVSKKCNSRCSAKIECNKRCQLARDKYQLALAKATYKKNNVKQYTSSQLNQRYYSGQVAKDKCNSRCQAAKKNYQKQRTQYMKTFHEPCQNGHIKNTGTFNGKPLSDQGNPSGSTPGDKTTIGSYGGVAKGRPLGAPGAGQINWPNSAKYNWRTDCKSYSVGNQGSPTPPPSILHKKIPLHKPIF
jgi:hypothetical protein